MVSPTEAFWFGPALASGAVFIADTMMLTESALLLTVPSLTTSDIAKVPAVSATKRGCTF
jgi:hypothetical protein